MFVLLSVNATLNGKHKIKAHSIRGLKTAASKKANATFNAVDTLEITHINGREVMEIPYTRINKKSPNNEIIRGKWR